MKKILLLLIICISSLSASAQSQENLFCAYKAAIKYKDIVKFTNFARDKYRHCTISCIVGIECGVTSMAIVGVAKEIYDVFGPGNAEWKDLLANINGLRFSQRDNINDLSACSNKCKSYYPIERAVFISKKL